MMTVKELINDLLDVLTIEGDIPVVITEQHEEGRPLTNIGSVTILDVGSMDPKEKGLDTVCIISTSKMRDVLNRIMNGLDNNEWKQTDD